MSVLAVLVFALQLALGFHCLKSGRGNTWLSIIMFVPVVGSILYIFTQLIPDLKQDPKAREAARKVSEQAQNWTDPQKHLRERLENLAVTDSDANRLALARECMEAQQA